MIRRIIITFQALWLILPFICQAQEADQFTPLSITEKFLYFTEKKDWILDGSPQVFQGGDLIEIERELSDIILEYEPAQGFRGIFISEKHELVLQLKLFLFPTQIQAFGFYAYDKSPSLEFYDVGFQAYLAGRRISVWYGKFVLQVESPDTLKDQHKIMREFARDFLNELPRQKQYTPILDCLPEKNCVEHSRKFSMSRWLSQDFFNNIYYADYHTPEGYSRIFIIDNGETAAADSNFWKYYHFMRENAEVYRDTLKIATDYIVVGEPLWGRTILAKKNQIIYGILDFRNIKWTEDRLQELLEGLKKRKIVKPG
ncbi:MAG: hypothetical protein EH225_07465 [Calditrichaeota bacterium]|nr:hypothetical protein [Calditrichota bacterium]RQW03183.1 MAG: hypothetical protein EH225_07465 [Calditrichota bacterium]